MIEYRLAKQVGAYHISAWTRADSMTVAVWELRAQSAEPEDFDVLQVSDSRPHPATRRWHSTWACS